MEKPFAESSEQNKLPILEVLQVRFAAPGRVLEIGSGTGQHAVFLAEQLPHLTWQPSDVAANLPGICLWCDEAQLANVQPPLVLDVVHDVWPGGPMDYVFSANTTHIMHWHMVEAMFAGIGRVLKADGAFCLYGPFNRDGGYTSESNARFDQWLKQRDPASGIRDLEALEALAANAGMRLVEAIPMPANNFILHWKRED